MSAQVRVRFFAQARSATGREHLERPLPTDDPTVRGVLRELEREWPALGRVISISRVVVNGEYVDHRGTRLRSGDEVSIHPPYSGG